MSSRDEQLIEIQPDEQFLKNYQAVYYAMNAKPDCKSKLFPKKVIVSLQDLCNLNERITDKFKAHYDNAGFRINVCVSYKNRESVEFDSWTTFEEYSWNTEKKIESILIVWEYNAKLPQYRLPQKHTLTVRIADELRPEKMLNLVFSGKLEEIDKIEQGVCPVIARVDFINSILGDELLGIVDSWQNGLLEPDTEIGILYKGLKKFSRVIAYAINYVPTIFALGYMLRYLKIQIEKLNVDTIGQISLNSFVQIIQQSIYGVIICIAVYKVFQVAANIVFAELRGGEDGHSFDITNGDKIECKNLEIKMKNKKIKIIGNIVLMLVFNVICSVIANFIS